MTDPLTVSPEPRAVSSDRIHASLLEVVGATPLVRLGKFAAAHQVDADLLGKLEFLNPSSSGKDRIALAMVEDAERQGRLKPGGTLIEPTSGNTGIALAYIAAIKGYRLILTMPESMSSERRKMLAHLGAEIVLTPTAKGMNGALAKARDLLERIPGAIMLQQFRNPANPRVHRETTAVEIWEDTGGNVDAVVAGVGTGGTLSGIAEVIKERNPRFKAIAVEPDASAVLSGSSVGSHKIQGIGPGFIPQTLNLGLIDEVIRVSDETAFATARAVARLEGIPGGISSGAALAAAVELGRRPEWAGKRIVVILASCAERYLSTPLFE